MLINHLARVLGWPRHTPVTADSVDPAEPDPHMERRAQEAAAEFINERHQVEQTAREVREQLAEGALEIVRH